VGLGFARCGGDVRGIVRVREGEKGRPPRQWLPEGQRSVIRA
jgi:hypothetical protein